jgi:hypothetical protein
MTMPNTSLAPQHAAHPARARGAAGTGRSESARTWSAFAGSGRVLRAALAVVALVALGAAFGDRTASAAAPDLVPTALIGVPAEVVPGQRIAFSWTVENRGDAAATAPWTDSVYYSDDAVLTAADPLVIGAVRNTSVAAQDSYTTTPLTAAIPGTATAGQKYLLLRADSGVRVAESDENNNVLVVPVTVRMPNLVPTALAGVPEVVAPRQVVALTATVANTGDGQALSPWQDFVFISSDATLNATDTAIGSRSIGAAVAAGSSYATPSITVTIPSAWPAGTAYLLLQTDRTSGVVESSETDNVLAVPITVGLPDLAPTNLTAPPVVSIGPIFSYPFSFTVHNGGTGLAVQSWTDSFYLSDDPALDATDQLVRSLGHVTALAAGEDYVVSQTFNFPATATTGNRYLILRIDDANALREADDANNPVAVPITVQAPDLVPTALNASGSAAPGQTIPVAWTVENRGPRASRASRSATPGTTCSTSLPTRRMRRPTSRSGSAATSCRSRMPPIPRPT